MLTKFFQFLPIFVFFFSINFLHTILAVQQQPQDPMAALMASMGGMGGMSLPPSMGNFGSVQSIGDMASNPLNALLMKKFGKEDASSCYAKIDLNPTKTHECMPEMAKLECGKSNLPSATTTQPWHIVIANDAGSIHCGGVLICSNWVLTTASCLKHLEETVDVFPQISLHANIIDASTLSTTTSLSVRRIVYHELYDKNAFGRQRLIHDIAAIQISTVTNMPICLPKLTDTAPAKSSTMYSFGHGKFSDADGDAAGALKQGEFIVTTTQDCSDKYGNIDFSRSICANVKGTTPEKPVCKGDRGGAAATHTDDGWTLAGLITGGPEDCDLTDIVSYYNFQLIFYHFSAHFFYNFSTHFLQFFSSFFTIFQLIFLQFFT